MWSFFGGSETALRTDITIVTGSVAHAIDAVRKHGDFHIALSGGSTPFPIMERLALAALDWHRVEVRPGDDRVVPEDHPASNTGRIRAIFAPVGARVVALDAGAPVLPAFAVKREFSL